MLSYGFGLRDTVNLYHSAVIIKYAVSESRKNNFTMPDDYIFNHCVFSYLKVVAFGTQNL